MEIVLTIIVKDSILAIKMNAHTCKRYAKAKKEARKCLEI